MSRNIGKVDEFIRILLGLSVLAYTVKDGVLMPAPGAVLSIGVYLLTTAFFKVCPLYSSLGWSSIGQMDTAADQNGSGE